MYEERTETISIEEEFLEGERLIRRGSFWISNETTAESPFLPPSSYKLSLSRRRRQIDTRLINDRRRRRRCRPLWIYFRAVNERRFDASLDLTPFKAKSRLFRERRAPSLPFSNDT